MHKRSRFYHQILFLLFAVSTSVLAQHTRFEAAIAKFESDLAADVAFDSIGSITAGVFVGTELVWVRAFGWADVAGQQPAEGETIYRTGSISKTFTAVVLMHLVEEGVVRLDDEVGQYLPAFKNLKKVSPNDRITFRHLATHTAGLAVEPDLPHAADGPIDTWENKIEESIPTIKVNTLPGEKYSYSNIGYGILGLAISRAAGKPFMDLVREVIFRPLHLDHTEFIPTSTQQPLVAVGYANERGEPLDWEKPRIEHAGRGYKVPNGGVYSDVHDLAIFGMFLAGIIKTNIVSQEGLLEMGNVQTPGDTENGYGYGLAVRTANGIKTIGHGGSVAGYTATLVVSPKQRVGVVLLRNYNRGRTILGRRARALVEELTEDKR